MLHLTSLVSLLLSQDLENVQMHLEEVRFFDLFGYSEEAGAWQCFMCNNPEKATGTGGSCLYHRWAGMDGVKLTGHAGCLVTVGKGETKLSSVYFNLILH